MTRLPHYLLDPWDDYFLEHEERECQKAMFALGRRCQQGGWSRQQFAYARRDLMEARQNRRRR
jgi:hypothetical protein